MSSEVHDAISKLMQAVSDDKVKCEHCGCMIPSIEITCPQCGAPLPDKKQHKTEKKREKLDNFDWQFSSNPNFNQDKWFMFYKNCYRLGCAMAEIFNGEEQVGPICASSEEDRWIRYSLLSKMRDGGTLSAKSQQLWFDNCSRWDSMIRDLKGFSSYEFSYGYSGINASIDPVVLGFIMNADGTNSNSRVGDTNIIIIRDLFNQLESLQELCILFESEDDDVLQEQYTCTLANTGIGAWCRDKETSVFASSIFRGWSETPANFNRVLNNERQIFKFYKDQIMFMSTSFFKERLEEFRKGISNTRTIDNILKVTTYIENYYKNRMARVLGIQHPEVSKEQLDELREFMVGTFGLDDFVKTELFNP